MGQWKLVFYIFKNKNVNSWNLVLLCMTGDIIGKPETLLIGACGMTGAFDGFLDEVSQTSLPLIKLFAFKTH